jgi:hypothetical protein
MGEQSSQENFEVKQIHTRSLKPSEYQNSTRVKNLDLPRQTSRIKHKIESFKKPFEMKNDLIQNKLEK